MAASALHRRALYVLSAVSQSRCLLSPRIPSLSESMPAALSISFRKQNSSGLGSSTESNSCSKEKPTDLPDTPGLLHDFSVCLRERTETSVQTVQAATQTVTETVTETVEKPYEKPQRPLRGSRGSSVLHPFSMAEQSLWFLTRFLNGLCDGLCDGLCLDPTVCVMVSVVFCPINAQSKAQSTKQKAHGARRATAGGLRAPTTPSQSKTS